MKINLLYIRIKQNIIGEILLRAKELLSYFSCLFMCTSFRIVVVRNSKQYVNNFLGFPFNFAFYCLLNRFTKKTACTHRSLKTFIYDPKACVKKSNSQKYHNYSFTFQHKQKNIDVGIYALLV